MNTIVAGLLAIVIASMVIVIVARFFIAGLFVVEQQTVAIIERFGKYNRAATAGLNLKIPMLEWVKGHLSLRIQQLDVVVETKTRDNVFVKIVVSVQYHVDPQNIFDAFYKLTDPKSQIESFVFDVIRAEVPKMFLDDVFEKKDNIAIAVKNELAGLMSEVGYSILKALVTNIDPDEKVKAAMNEINEQQRLRMAAQEKGEAEKIIRVKKAEAEADSMQLQGVGIANERKAIIEGMMQTIEQFQQRIPGSTVSEIINLVLMTQYYDTIKEVGSKDKSNTIFLPHTPSGVHDFTSQVRNMVSAKKIVDEITN